MELNEILPWVKNHSTKISYYNTKLFYTFYIKITPKKYKIPPKNTKIPLKKQNSPKKYKNGPTVFPPKKYKIDTPKPNLMF